VPPINQVQASSLTPTPEYSRAGTTTVAAYSAASAPYPPQYLTPQQPQHQQQKKQLMNGGLRYAQMPPLQQLAMMTPPPPVIDPAVVAANERAAAAVEAMEIVFDSLDRLFEMAAQAEFWHPEAVIRAVVADRERTLYRLTQLRQVELLSLPETTSDSLRRKAVIEGKQLMPIALRTRRRQDTTPRAPAGPRCRPRRARLWARERSRLFCRPGQCSLTNSYVDDNSCLISE
jgi:hypothetical protein